MNEQTPGQPPGESPSGNSNPGLAGNASPLPLSDSTAPADTTAIAGAGLPGWVPYFAVAAVTAVIVGLAVYFLAGKDSSSGDTTAILDGFLTGGRAASGIETFKGRLPSDFPTDFPLYGGAEIVSAYKLPSEEGTTFLVIISTTAGVEQVYNFYLESLDEGSWQVEAARSSDEFTGVAFSRTDSADVEGQLNIYRSESAGKTSVYVSYNDISLTSDPASQAFQLKPSRPLPPGFPTDIPIYKGKSGDSVIFDTVFQRGGGGRIFYVSFLTKDSQDDVINFYRNEFQRRGWTVTEAEASATSFEVGIDFTDGQRQEVVGNIYADAFEDDPSYVRVDLQLQVSGSRSRGN